MTCSGVNPVLPKALGSEKAKQGEGGGTRAVMGPQAPAGVCAALSGWSQLNSDTDTPTVGDKVASL